ncbi:AI-2E family transporter [Xanthobacter sp. DSM 24535]|uniref:AI-2E family transporter n=1 Tax=Roseixanthobacter psychrophilus TaxID=3119917 RepID=UPI00372B7AA4
MSATDNGAPEKRGVTLFPREVVRPSLLPAGSGAVGTLVAMSAIVAMLYFGREVLVPVALAVLLSFVLAPVILVLRRLKVPRTLSVTSVVVVTFLALVALGAVVASQVVELAGDLPQYQVNIRDKIRSLRGATEGSGTLERAAQMLQDLSNELDRPEPPNPINGIRPEGVEQPPLPVEIRQPNPGTLGMLSAVMTPLIHPLATTGIIFIFLIFILLQREDLRNRFIRLAGASDIQRTTAALDDAASRLSRFFLMQVALNAAFGTVIGIGLWLIGVPSPILWGFMAAVLRFVPYIGAIIAALLPIALALAVDPGWSIVLSTIALFVIVEPLIGHIIEPLVYGRSTGLSPVAIVASATFWTWLWGPVGLVLATPLTLCLVVLGRHVDQLEFLDVMLGDRPPLSAPELFYQRMLAGDPTEATSKAEEFLRERSFLAYLDHVALPGLRLAQNDLARGTLDEGRIERFRSSLGELLDNLSDIPNGMPKGDTKEAEAGAAIAASPAGATYPVLDPKTLPPRWQGEEPILCIAARSGLDQAAADLLANLLKRHGLAAQVAGPETLTVANLAKLSGSDPALTILSSLESAGTAHMRYSTRRLRRRLPRSTILLAAWGARDDSAMRGSLESQSDTDIVTSNLEETLSACLMAASSTSQADAESPIFAPAPAGRKPEVGAKA